MEKLPSPVWNARLGAAVNARRGLPPLVSAYFRAGREFLASRPSPAQLHELRLATKRLRYTLELFRRCYGPELERYLAELTREMPASPLRDKLEKFLSCEEASRSQRVREVWTGQFDAAGREAAWVRYLGRLARGSIRRPATH
jgi:hypothetical protein